jgi:hypothetical protein
MERLVAESKKPEVQRSVWSPTPLFRENGRVDSSPAKGSPFYFPLPVGIRGETSVSNRFGPAGYTPLRSFVSNDGNDLAFAYRLKKMGNKKH